MKFFLHGRNLSVIYLVLSLPVLLALSFLTGPFEVPDEPAHFLRADQISRGGVAPVLAPSAHAAGGFVDPAAALLAERLGSNKITRDPAYRFHAGDVWAASPSRAGESPVFEIFSNTVIYFPIAHLIPAMGILAAKLCSHSALVWFYAARLCNALAAMAISALAIFLFEESGLFAFVFCLLPMVLFEEASVSADALVIPCSILFAALTARIASGRGVGWRSYGGVFLTSLAVCVAKFAYLPLGLAPVLLAVLRKRFRNEIYNLLAIFAVTAMIWAAWAWFIHAKVFTVEDHPGIVDVNGQIAYLRTHPAAFAAIFNNSLRQDWSFILNGMVGAQLGWINLNMPRLSTCLSLEAVLLAIVLANPGAAIGWPARVAIGLLVYCTLAVVYLLLYLQFTVVGSQTVDGMQGRYCLPLLAMAPLVVPGIFIGPAWVQRLAVVLIGVSGLNAFATVLFVGSHYW